MTHRRQSAEAAFVRTREQAGMRRMVFSHCLIGVIGALLRPELFDSSDGFPVASGYRMTPESNRASGAEPPPRNDGYG